MPLIGQAKTDYQREYMRKRRSNGLTSEVRPDGECYKCGRFGVVDRHHIDKDHNNNGDSNLRLLCPNCHTDIHRRGKLLDPVEPWTGELTKAKQVSKMATLAMAWPYAAIGTVTG